MTQLKKSYKRAKPLLGTIVSITISVNDRIDIEPLFNRCFQEIEKLQKIFNFHDCESELSILNQYHSWEPLRISEDLFSLLRTCHFLLEATGGAFTPYLESGVAAMDLYDDNDNFYIVKRYSNSVDLGGIAKGFIVDRVCEILRESGVCAVVNAGGDLRRVGEPISCVIKMGDADNLFARNFTLHLPALATSSQMAQGIWEKSTTIYRKPFASYLPKKFTAVVNSSKCALADALTKALIHGDKENLQEQFSLLGALGLIFDEKGALHSGFGTL